MYINYLCISLSSGSKSVTLLVPGEIHICINEKPPIAPMTHNDVFTRNEREPSNRRRQQFSVESAKCDHPRHVIRRAKLARRNTADDQSCAPCGRP